MKAFNLLLRTVISLAVLVTFIVAQEQKPPSQGEIDAAKKVQTAQGLPAKFKQSEEFMKKNAKSALRIKVAEYMAGEITNVADPAQRLSYVESYNKIFSADNEKELVLATQVDALAMTDKTEEAFKLAPKAVAKSPDNAFLLTQLALRGSNAVRQGKAALAAPSKEYGEKAVQLMEANQKPAQADEQFWNDFKQKWLPELYNALGFIAMAREDGADAKVKFEKSVALNPANPNAYLMLASFADTDYQRAAMEYNTASGAAKDAALKKAYGHLDSVIDHYAHVVALTASKAELKQMHDQVKTALEETYKIRHGSLNGLQEKIEKFKK